MPGGMHLVGFYVYARNARGERKAAPDSDQEAFYNAMQRAASAEEKDCMIISHS